MAYQPITPTYTGEKKLTVSAGTIIYELVYSETVGMQTDTSVYWRVVTPQANREPQSLPSGWEYNTFTSCVELTINIPANAPQVGDDADNFYTLVNSFTI